MQLSIKNPNKARSQVERDLFCLNCRNLLRKDERGIDGKRFCSNECKGDYLASGHF